MEIKGLDISYYQRGISFDAIKKSVDFVILRAGFTGWGTGVSYNKDNCFEDFYAQAKAKGLGVGAYWYSCADSYNKGKAEAEYLYNNCLKGKQFDYPIYIDVEEPKWQTNKKYGVTQAIIGFCEYLENKGYYAGIYASDLSGFKDKMNMSELNAYDKWVARYGSQPTYAKPYGMWQYTSSGKISGYSGNLDMNIAYKDYPAIIKKAGLNGYAKNTSSKPVEKKKTIEELAREVIDGKWGTKDTKPTRKERLTKAGYDYDKVQAKVNELLKVKKPSSVVYVVKKGDTLTSIAKKFGTTYQKIAKDNNIANPNKIYTGQKLTIYK